MADEKRGPRSIPEGERAAEMRDAPGASDAGPIDQPAEGVLTLVCVRCGQEYYFADQDPPEGMVCEKCGNHVFRDFFTAEDGDDAAVDFHDSTDRDLDPDDAEGDALPGDVLDLNRD
jgi:hypothetical protein